MRVPGRKLLRNWSELGPRFLPFADAASPDLPLLRLLRLSLFQVSVGMALVLLVGTLNRVMIVELGVPASLVGVMVSLPVLFAPLRALIGFRSDTHQSALGWRRVPFIWKGTLLQFGGFAIMPFALLVLSGGGESQQWPAWLGHLGAAAAFLLVGAGLHTTQTAGLALATDLAAPEAQPRVVGLMYVAQLVGMLGSALVFGELLREFTPARLVQVIQGAAVATIVLNGLSLWKQETRQPPRGAARRSSPGFRESWARFRVHAHATRRLAAIALGTLAFSMQDVLLEPYGGQILGLTVSGTTFLTATLAFGGLVGFGFASRVLGRGADPIRMAAAGAAVGVPAFIAVIAAGPLGEPMLFGAGVWLIGLGGGLFGHGTLTATMNLAPRDQVGLALGVWGAVQATAAGIGVAAGALLRDAINAWSAAGAAHAATGYTMVYGIETALLLATLAVLLPMSRRDGSTPPLFHPESR